MNYYRNVANDQDQKSMGIAGEFSNVQKFQSLDMNLATGGRGIYDIPICVIDQECTFWASCLLILDRQCTIEKVAIERKLIK